MHNRDAANRPMHMPQPGTAEPQFLQASFSTTAVADGPVSAVNVSNLKVQR